MPVRYCASDQLKVGEGSHKFAPVIATGGYQEVHNVIGRDISVPFSGTLNLNSITSECCRVSGVLNCCKVNGQQIA